MSKPIITVHSTTTEGDIYYINRNQVTYGYYDSENKDLSIYFSTEENDNVSFDTEEEIKQFLDQFLEE